LEAVLCHANHHSTLEHVKSLLHVSLEQIQSGLWRAQSPRRHANSVVGSAAGADGHVVARANAAKRRVTAEDALLRGNATGASLLQDHSFSWSTLACKWKQAP
jgi:hypothetical protein